MNILLALLAFLEPVSVATILIVLAQLSKRLGAVTRRAPLYRWYYIAATLVGLGVVFRLAGMDEQGRLVSRAGLIYDIPVILGLLIALIVTWRYWGWMLYERDTER